MTTWIEPPPPQKGMGCFGKGCLILIAFLVVLTVAFVAGTYFAVRYVRNTYLPPASVELPLGEVPEEKQQEVRARWYSFERAARAGDAARIELTADDLNALIASQPKLRGRAYVSIDENVGRLHLSVPLDGVRLMKGHYINAECSVQSAAGGNPADARVTSIVVNGRPVGEEVLRWQYGKWSVRRYMSYWSEENNLKTFEIQDGKVILESKDSE